MLDAQAPDRVEQWRGFREPRAEPIVLNVAGPRESQSPGPYDATLALLEELAADPR